MAVTLIKNRSDEEKMDKGTYNYATKTNRFSRSSEHGKCDMDPYFRQFGINRFYRFFTGNKYRKEDYNTGRIRNIWDDVDCGD